MKKIFKIFVTIVIIFFMYINFATVFATKEDLKTPSEKGQTFGGYSASEIIEACKYMDANSDGHISVNELQDKIDSGEDIDKYLTILRVFSNDSQNKAEDANINYLYKVEGEGKDKKIVKNAELIELLKKAHNERREEEGLSKLEDLHIDQEMNMAKYYAPEKDTSATSSGKSIDNVIEDAKDFISKAKDDVGTVEESSLQSFSNAFYNIFLTVGTAIAVIAGIIIGIKYMLGSVEEQADVKRMLVPYAVGCVVVFGSFGIWKIIIEILNNII